MSEDEIDDQYLSEDDRSDYDDPIEEEEEEEESQYGALEDDGVLPEADDKLPASFIHRADEQLMIKYACSPLVGTVIDAAKEGLKCIRESTRGARRDSDVDIKIPEDFAGIDILNDCEVWRNAKGFHFFGTIFDLTGGEGNFKLLPKDNQIFIPKVEDIMKMVLQGRTLERRLKKGYASALKLVRVGVSAPNILYTDTNLWMPCFPDICFWLRHAAETGAKLPVPHKKEAKTKATAPVEMPKTKKPAVKVEKVEAKPVKKATKKDTDLPTIDTQRIKIIRAATRNGLPTFSQKDTSDSVRALSRTLAARKKKRAEAASDPMDVDTAVAEDSPKTPKKKKTQPVQKSVRSRPKNSPPKQKAVVDDDTPEVVPETTPKKSRKRSHAEMASKGLSDNPLDLSGSPMYWAQRKINDDGFPIATGMKVLPRAQKNNELLALLTKPMSKEEFNSEANKMLRINCAALLSHLSVEVNDKYVEDVKSEDRERKRRKMQEEEEKQDDDNDDFDDIDI